jgi:hypothetical protein
MRRFVFFPYCILVLCGTALRVFGEDSSQEDVIHASSIAVVLGDKATDKEQRYAELLIQRILKRSAVGASIVESDTAPAVKSSDLAIYLGSKETHPRLTELLTAAGMPMPATKSPGPEGFALKSMKSDHGGVILAAGADPLGTLYSVGEILRRLTYLPESVEINEYAFQTAPAYKWRGMSANQGGTMMELTGAKRWTYAERHDVDLERALAGANTAYEAFEGIDWANSYGIKVVQGFRPNQLPQSLIQPEWRKKETERGDFVCPSVPEAREALIKYYTKIFERHPDTAVVRFFAGDPGGCRCEECQPWGRTFFHLCEELGVIWKRFHPNSEIQIANQDVDNEGDEAIFAALNEKPCPWLNSLSYGPGSNAMSKYFRRELREDLFTYPGHGPINRYLAYTLQNLPKNVSIVHYSDITHWISAQYQVENPEPHLVRIYGRRTFHQRPKAFYRIFQQIMPFSEGDIIYSEGYHDDLHQYLWNRLLWNPNRSLDEVMMEYATYWFGQEAAPEMVEASYQLEENLEAPLETNPGIDRYYQLVKSAGTRIPPNLMKVDHHWRIAMQKADLDKYFQLKIRRENELSGTACALLEKGRQSGNYAEDILAASATLSLEIETAEMRDLREDANRLGDESGALFGVRNEGYPKTGLDLTGLAWFRCEVQLAAMAAGGEDQGRWVDALLDYENPGPDGFYDAAGIEGHHPHLKQGESLSNPGMFEALLDPKNRPSANAFGYNRTGPVVFAYSGLHPEARYKLKFALVAPRITPEFLRNFGIDSAQIKRSEDIWADDVLLEKELEIPQYTARQFEYEIPPSATRDGHLEVRFDAKPPPGSFSSSLVSEVWLVKQ